MQRLEDPALMNLIKNQDEGALSELYDRYHRLIFSIALKVVGDSSIAEEITLDIFTRVWEKADSYRQEQAKVTTWMARMTRNRSIDILRREGVRPMKDSIGWAEVTHQPAADNPSPEAAAQLAIQKERVRKAVATLPDTQKEALALAYFKGLTHSEIANELGIPLGTVKGRIRSGMGKLRKLLVDE
jgi:RNA polymerase sigma-70 factor (ECF subfamily)